jgi:hypothetical protein
MGDTFPTPLQAMPTPSKVEEGPDVWVPNGRCRGDDSFERHVWGAER